jgi:hypothetical protein
MAPTSKDPLEPMLTRQANTTYLLLESAHYGNKNAPSFHDGALTFHQAVMAVKQGATIFSPLKHYMLSTNRYVSFFHPSNRLSYHILQPNSS